MFAARSRIRKSASKTLRHRETSIKWKIVAGSRAGTGREEEVALSDTRRLGAACRRIGGLANGFIPDCRSSASTTVLAQC